MNSGEPLIERQKSKFGCLKIAPKKYTESNFDSLLYLFQFCLYLFGTNIEKSLAQKFKMVNLAHKSQYVLLEDFYGFCCIVGKIRKEQQRAKKHF